MVVFPNCKINLGLNIIRKRKDNYHDLETIFYPINFTEVLEIIPAEDKNIFSVSGLPLSNDESNLCIKAFNLLKNDFPDLPFVKMHLHKAIPMGAGLGGGSADAAFALQLLKIKFNLDIPEKKLAEYALQLGSDCAFFLVNKPSLATSRGEILEPVNIDLSPYKILLVNPGIHINTAWAFSELKPEIPKQSIAEVIKKPIDKWKDELTNDFEIPVFKTYPALQKIKNDLYCQGALYASMSGSGSTLYGLFHHETNIVLPKGDNYFYKIIL